VASEWTQTAKKSGVTLFTHNQMNSGTLITRRVDLTINASAEKIAKLSCECNTFFKMMKQVESAKVIKTLGKHCICQVKGKALSANEPKREALVACST
jgi:hypothetical protein